MFRPVFDKPWRLVIYLASSIHKRPFWTCIDDTGIEGYMAEAERLLLRPSEAGDAIGVSRSKVYELIASGELPSVDVGGVRRVPVEALRDWIKTRLRMKRSQQSK